MFDKWRSPETKLAREKEKKQRNCNHFYEASQNSWSDFDRNLSKIPFTSPPFRQRSFDNCEDELYTVCLRCDKEIVVGKVPTLSSKLWDIPNAALPNEPSFKIHSSDDLIRRIDELESEVAELKDIFTDHINSIDKFVEAQQTVANLESFKDLTPVSTNSLGELFKELCPKGGLRRRMRAEQ